MFTLQTISPSLPLPSFLSFPSSSLPLSPSLLPLSPSFFTQASIPAAERLTQAVRWLEKCVQQFYQISTETKPDHNETLLLYRLAWAGACTETIMSQTKFYLCLLLVFMYVLTLCRKLLRQLVPYAYQPPEFAEGVDPKQLGQNLTHLWLCYW